MLALFWRSPRACEAALLATDRWREIVKPFSRHCVRTIQPEIIRAGVARVEARTWDQHVDSIRFLDFFGAAAECVIPGWGRQGETFIQYAWTAPASKETET